MQNRYTGDIGDFGKFLLIKHLFPDELITTVWYLYPDESHNTDGYHTVEEGNSSVYKYCHTLDPHMSQLFNSIHQQPLRRVELFETYGVLSEGSYFTEGISGEGSEYRKGWLERSLDFIRIRRSRVVCLDPDNGIEPISMNKLSSLKQGKYATYAEIEQFFELEEVQYLVIYQHFHRQCSHETQMHNSKSTFERLYKGRAAVTIIRHNPVQARFYIILSKAPLSSRHLEKLCSLRYGDRAFFTLLE